MTWLIAFRLAFRDKGKWHPHEFTAAPTKEEARAKYIADFTDEIEGTQEFNDRMAAGEICYMRGKK